MHPTSGRSARGRLEIVDGGDAGRERARMARGMRGARTAPGVELALSLGDDVSTKVVVRLRKLHQCKRAQTATNVHGESLQSESTGRRSGHGHGAKLGERPTSTPMSLSVIFTSPLRRRTNLKVLKRCDGLTELSSMRRIGTMCGVL